MACRFLPAYEFQPLQQEHEIRLLRVTSTSDSPQQCDFTLIHTTIDHAPPYETISYVWGPNLLNRSLALSTGTVLRINENLERVLNRAVRHCLTGYLWVDQVCINQADTAERNHQVKIMGQIYRSCVRVLVWLGCDDLPGCSSLDFVCETANDALERGLPKHELVQRLQTVLLGDAVMKNHEIAMYPDDEQLALWQLYKYLGSSWFSRAWVFQEIVLPLRSGILIGSSAISLEGLYWICTTIDSIETEVILPDCLDEATLSCRGLRIVPIMQRTWKSLHLPGDLESVPYPSITQLLSSIAPDMQTSVPQDRVYAFLGLNLDPRIVIEPNYRHSELEVQVCTAKAIVQGSNRLDIFEHLCRSGDGDQDRPFSRRRPTWAPDFTRQEHLTHFSISQALSRQPQGGFYMYPHIGKCDSKTLTAHGRRIDRIRSRIDPRLPPCMEGTYFDFSHYVTSAVHGWELSQRQVPRPTAQTVLAALLAQGHSDNGLVARCFSKTQLLGGILMLVVRHYFDRLEVKSGVDKEVVTSECSWEQLQEATSAIYHVAYKRYLFVTDDGRLALGCTLEPGDEIWVLHGCTNPVALRTTNEGTYCVQETCFLEDWMDPWGTGMVDWNEEDGVELRLV